MKLRKLTARLPLTLIAALLFFVPRSTPAQSTDELQSMEASGTVGKYPIGLNYTVRQHTQLVEAHYFYVSQSKNIPLTGSVTGQTVHLHGTDGSDFTLHFVGNGSNGKDPLNFYNSIGLQGTWSLAGRELPVKLSFDSSTENPGTRLYSQVTDKSDADFEAMVAAAKDAILSGNRPLAAKYVHFPLYVNMPHHRLILRSAGALATNWSAIFTPELIAKLRNDSTHEMFVHNGGAMLGNGELWFDNKGLVSVNPSVFSQPAK